MRTVAKTETTKHLFFFVKSITKKKAISSQESFFFRIDSQRHLHINPIENVVRNAQQETSPNRRRRYVYAMSRSRDYDTINLALERGGKR